MKSTPLRIILAVIVFVLFLFLVSFCVRHIFTPAPPPKKVATPATNTLSPVDHYGRDVAWMQSVLAFRYDSEDIRNGTGEYTRQTSCDAEESPTPER